MKLSPAFCLLPFLLLASCNGTTTSKPVQTTSKTDTAMVKPAPANSYNPYVPVDVSPMDMSYFPADYPVLKMSKKTSSLPLARVVYSRPHRQGRKIFDGLLKYGEPWRLGANEATEIELFQPATIQHKKINKGRYVLYCIPQDSSWTIVFNSNTYTWGLKQ